MRALPPPLRGRLPLSAAVLFAIVLALPAGAARATEPWPGAPWQEATVLTALDGDFQRNLSGAHWNPETRTLWVCLNAPGRFWALVEDGLGGFVVAEQDGRRGEWSVSGDLEGITQVDPLEPAIYLISEGLAAVEKYDVSVYGTPVLLRRWNLSSRIAPADWAGAEGITFVPDEWLARAGFVDGGGVPTVSRRGMGGLMFVAHQSGGIVHVFDLDPASDAWDYVGAYVTSRGESSGLDFDRSSGTLFIWHNTGSNYLELSDLTSRLLADGRRQLTTVAEYAGPRSGNLEGFAATPADSGEGWCFFTDDDNQDGGALSWYRDCDFGLAPLPDPPDEPAPFVLDVRVDSGADDVEEASDGSVDVTSTDLELTLESSQQTIGVRFAAVDLPRRAHIRAAWLQFTVDEVATGATALTIAGEAAPSAAAFRSTPQDVSRRPRTAAAVAWSPPAWSAVGEAGAAQRTPDLSAIVQELVDGPGWVEGNALAFLVTGSGKRVAESCDGVPAAAPLLHVVFDETLTERVIDACTTEWCDPAGGCERETLSCDDGDACTIDACDPETGCASAARACDDGDPCTADSCAPQTGCVFAPTDCEGGPDDGVVPWLGAVASRGGGTPAPPPTVPAVVCALLPPRYVEGTGLLPGTTLVCTPVAAGRKSAQPRKPATLH